VVKKGGTVDGEGMGEEKEGTGIHGLTASEVISNFSASRPHVAVLHDALFAVP